MATSYSYRRYRDGDADAINDLYFRITGIRRTLDEFSWQWLRAPGGAGEMWLIEATHPGGGTELIGHHGVMPIRFTRGHRDLLFGKTENTMVLPEFRRKILYPRMEQAFAREYEPRFDALFSTTGPGEAIRQRAAMRYGTVQHWKRLEWGDGVLGSVALGASRVPRLQGLLPLLAKLPTRPFRASDIRFEALAPDEARREPFFETYWADARTHAGVAPARFREDLEWRFWSNPHVQATTFVMDGAAGKALALVDLSRPSLARILDWSCDGMAPGNAESGMRALLFRLAKQFRVRVATFSTTDDAYDEHFRQGLERLFRPTLLTRVRRLEATPAPMPRKLTARGLAAGVPAAGWQVTPILFEGR